MAVICRRRDPLCFRVFQTRKMTQMRVVLSRMHKQANQQLMQSVVAFGVPLRCALLVFWQRLQGGPVYDRDMLCIWRAASQCDHR